MYARLSSRLLVPSWSDSVAFRSIEQFSGYPIEIALVRDRGEGDRRTQASGSGAQEVRFGSKADATLVSPKVLSGLLS